MQRAHERRELIVTAKDRKPICRAQPLVQRVQAPIPQEPAARKWCHRGFTLGGSQARSVISSGESYTLLWQH